MRPSSHRSPSRAAEPLPEARRLAGTSGAEPGRARPGAEWEHASLPGAGRAARQTSALATQRRSATSDLIGLRGRARGAKLASRQPPPAHSVVARTFARPELAPAPRRHSGGRCAAGPRGAAWDREPGLPQSFPAWTPPAAHR